MQKLVVKKSFVDYFQFYWLKTALNVSITNTMVPGVYLLIKVKYEVIQKIQTMKKIERENNFKHVKTVYMDGYFYLLSYLWQRTTSFNRSWSLFD